MHCLVCSSTTKLFFQFLDHNNTTSRQNLVLMILLFLQCIDLFLIQQLLLHQNHWFDLIPLPSGSINLPTCISILPISSHSHPQPAHKSAYDSEHLFLKRTKIWTHQQSSFLQKSTSPTCCLTQLLFSSRSPYSIQTRPNQTAVNLNWCFWPPMNLEIRSPMWFDNGADTTISFCSLQPQKQMNQPIALMVFICCGESGIPYPRLSKQHRHLNGCMSVTKVPTKPSSVWSPPQQKRNRSLQHILRCFHLHNTFANSTAKHHQMKLKLPTFAHSTIEITALLHIPGLHGYQRPKFKDIYIYSKFEKE